MKKRVQGTYLSVKYKEISSNLSNNQQILTEESLWEKKLILGPVEDTRKQKYIVKGMTSKDWLCKKIGHKQYIYI